MLETAEEQQEFLLLHDRYRNLMFGAADGLSSQRYFAMEATSQATAPIFWIALICLS